MIFGLTDICLFTQGNATKYDFDFFIEKIFVIKDNPPAFDWWILFKHKTLYINVNLGLLTDRVRCVRG